MIYLLNTDVEFSSFVTLYKEGLFHSLNDYKNGRSIDNFKLLKPMQEIIGVFSKNITDLNFLNLGEVNILSNKLFEIISAQLIAKHSAYKLSAFNTRGKKLRNDLFIVIFDEKLDALDLNSSIFSGDYKEIFSAPNEMVDGKITRLDKLTFKELLPEVFICSRLPDTIFPLFVSQTVADKILREDIRNIELIPEDDLFTVDLSFDHVLGYFVSTPTTERLSHWKKRPSVPNRRDLWDPQSFDPEKITFD